MNYVLIFLQLFTLVGGLVFAYALGKDLYIDVTGKGNKYHHREKFCIWSKSFIAIWIYTVLNVILLMCGIRTQEIMWWKVLQTGIFVWYFYDLYNTYVINKNTVRR